ncbi:MAG: ABC transporter ATP-binding protein [bacterium]|nr:ABC transporter ATP-binding protein [bacterium]
MATIELSGICHRYPGTPDFALQPTDVTCEDGQTYALLGPSGCGKTTLLGTISGLLRPAAGRVLFDGRDVTQLETRQRNVAQVFQFPVVYDTMSVYDNLAFPLRNRWLAPQDVDERVRAIAVLLDLDTDLKRRARGLPADAKQRVALGRGLVREDVAAVLLDEPLTAVDPKTKWELRSKLREVHAELAPTLIYVTHDQNEALTVADRVFVMNAGRIVQEGTPQELFEHPAHTFVARFIGSPGMNIVACELAGASVRVAGRAFSLNERAAALGARGSAELGVRPELARLGEQAVPDSHAARVVRVEDFGRHRIVTVDLGGERFAVKVADGLLPREGTSLWLSLPAEHIRLFANGEALR